MIILKMVLYFPFRSWFYYVMMLVCIAAQYLLSLDSQSEVLESVDHDSDERDENEMNEMRMK